MKIVFALLIAFVAPLILLPIEKVLPYPYIFEELIKLSALLLILSDKKNRKWVWAFLVGFLFTVSESFLYLSNFFMTENFSLFPLRIFLTGILHIGTTLLMYWVGRKSSIYLLLGFVCAVVIHYFYNIVIINIFK